MNIRDRRGIHRAAGQSLENAKGDPGKILLIYLGIVTALSLVVAVASVLLSNRIADTGGLGNLGLRSVLSTAKTVLPLVQSLVFLGLEMGHTTMALRISRGESVSKDTLFGGFRRFFPLLRAKLALGFIYMGLAMVSLYLSVYLFLMLPASTEFYSIMTPVMESLSAQGGVVTQEAIMSLDQTALTAAYDALIPLFLIFALVFALVFVPAHYRYRMVTYRLIDHPRPGVLRALFESRVMMRRNRFALFRLDLQLWWFYALQVLITAVCFGDMLLPMFGIMLPISSTASDFLFLGLSLALQFAGYYFCMNRVAVTYATAYGALLPKEEEAQEPPKPAAVPWKDQY